MTHRGSIPISTVFVCLGLLVGCGAADGAPQALAQAEPEPVAEQQQALLPCDLSAPFKAPTRAFRRDPFPGLMGQYDGLTIANDGKTIYLSGRHAAGSSYDIMRIDRASTAVDFSEAEPPLYVITPGAGLSSVTTTGVDDRAPALSTDNTKMYLYKRNAAGNDDIYEVSRTTPTPAPSVYEFGSVTPLGSTVNTQWHDQDPFYLGVNQNLFFASQRDSSGVQRDLYRLQGTTRVKLPNPSTGAAINTSDEEWRPVVSPNGLTLYFASGRAGGIGNDFVDGDIYMATRTSLNSGFSNVTNLWALNSSGKDFPVAVSADGCTLYFASNEYTGLGSTEAYQLFEAKRPEVAPPSVTLTVKISGTGSLTQGGFNCSHTGGGVGGTGTCAVNAAPNTMLNVVASGPAVWQGTCTARNSSPNNDGVLVWAENSECTLTFP